MLRLHDYLPSQNAYKVRMLLGHLGLAYEVVPVEIFQGRSRTPAFLEMNPAGAVPVLEIGPGRFIAESNAILCYLAEGTIYLPTDRFERAKVMQWLFFEQDYVQPSIATIRHWTMTGKLERNAAQAPGRKAAGERVLDLLDHHLAGRAFLADTGYSIADIAVFAYVHLAEEEVSTFRAAPRFAPGSIVSPRNRARCRRFILIQSILIHIGACRWSRRWHRRSLRRSRAGDPR